MPIIHVSRGASLAYKVEVGPPCGVVDSKFDNCWESLLSEEEACYFALSVSPARKRTHDECERKFSAHVLGAISDMTARVLFLPMWVESNVDSSTAPPRLHPRLLLTGVEG